jgi:S-adenosylmethionine decarboxylase
MKSVYSRYFFEEPTLEHVISEALDTVIQIPGKIPLPPTGFTSGDESEDHFIVRDGQEFAGTHLILDLWDARHLDDLERMERAMRECVKVSGATLLHIHLHHFTPSGGISGVAVLAESHISVHTWPERDYAAFDIFMCGDAVPEMSIPVLKQHFFPGRMEITEQLRGVVRK